MLVPAAAFFAALAVTLLLTPLVRSAAVDADLLDQPGGRKIHVRAIPRLGGAAMLVAFGVAVAVGLGVAAVTGADGGDLLALPLLPILLGVGIVGAVGLVDDLRDLSPVAKLGGQLLASVVVVALGLRLDEIGTPWGGVALGLLGPVITVGWLVAVANAVNLIDGLDGLAAGVSLAALVAFGVIAAMLGAPVVLLLAAAAAGAVLAFLVYNRPPASIIMGDAGAMFLGMLLGAMAVALVNARPAHIALPTAIVALGVPLADMAWAILRRLAAGRSVFAADSSHIHHQLMGLGLSRGRVTIVLVGASALLGLVAVLLAR
jgi:UDP-GlcNAc:undecaprenyl-phosphate GlcNAc-1-phosphate transferase